MEANKELSIQEILEKWLPTPEGAYETDDIIRAMKEYASPWKLKYDEMKAENEKLKQIYLDMANGTSEDYRNLALKHVALKDQAHRLADALSKFISMHETGLLPDRFTYEHGLQVLSEYNQSKGGKV